MEVAKVNMVEQQIRPWNVLDETVLEIMQEAPREKFVPPQFKRLAYADMNIPIGDNQVMMQPKLEARMLQALAPKNMNSHWRSGLAPDSLRLCWHNSPSMYILWSCARILLHQHA